MPTRRPSAPAALRALSGNSQARGMPNVAMLSMTNSERAKSNAAAAALAAAARTVTAT